MKVDGAVGKSVEMYSHVENILANEVVTRGCVEVVRF
jgi:hypothetical protein